MFFLLVWQLQGCGPTDGEKSDLNGTEDTQSPESEPGEEWTDTGGVSQDELGDAAQIVSIAFPHVLECGETATGTVVVENTGTTSWTRADAVKLGAVGDDDPLFDSPDVRVWLDEDDFVAPGDRYAFEIALVGSTVAAREISDWQMVREGVHWFGAVASTDVIVYCEDDQSGSEPPLPLPDMSHVVDDLATERPDLLAGSCLADGGSWEFLDVLVDRLRNSDERWGYNWKRGVEGDPSQDVVDYHYGQGSPEGSTEVYIIDVIVGHCGEGPGPGWLDQTQATADAGTIGKWTGRGRF